MRILLRQQASVALAGERVPSYCMHLAWKASNFLDSLTDAWYGGSWPAQPDYDRTNDALLAIERGCGISMTQVLGRLVESEGIAAAKIPENFEEGKRQAGAARTEMQKVLEGLGP